MSTRIRKMITATLAVSLFLPAAVLAQVVIGDWDGMTDEGWIDHGNVVSITDPVNTNKYSFEASMGAPVTALRIDQSGWNQNLRLDLQNNGLVDAFMTNNQIRFEFSVPAWTDGGYSGVELVLNVEGYGFVTETDFTVEGEGHNGNVNGPQMYFWSGSPQRTLVVTYNYHHVLATLGGATPGFAEIIFQSNNGGGAPEYFQINDVTLVAGLPPLIPAGVSPNGVTTDSTPAIEAYFEDGTDTVDTNSISMTVDGVAVTAGYSYVASNTLSTISYTPDIPYERDSVHTALVVVASSPGGELYTNEWSFTVLDLDGITYVDASDVEEILMAALPDGPVGAGLPLATNTTDTSDGIWRARTGLGLEPGTTNLPTGIAAVTTGGDGTVLESTAWVDPADNTPRLKVTAGNLDHRAYHVYLYYWTDEAGSPWGIRAGLEDTPGTDSLPQITDGIRIATDDASLNEGRQLLQAYLGMVSGTNITVYIEDLPATDGNSRTWFDGLGYEVSGPTLDPDIVSITGAGDTITLTWVSEPGISYTIMEKTDLVNSPDWTPIKTGIIGDESTTTDSVSTNGTGKGFYSIEGN